MMCIKCPGTERQLVCEGGTLAWKGVPLTWYAEGKFSGDEGISFSRQERKWEAFNQTINADSPIHTCFNDVCCRHPKNSDGASDDESRVECATDSGYYGPLCGGCDMKYVDPRTKEKKVFLRDGFVCKMCPKNWEGSELNESIILVCVLVAVIFAVVVYIAAFRSTRRAVDEYGGVIRRLAFSYMQVRSLS
jgi:hypothetical protein